jgi:(2Fe-2S) ferredoxin
MEATTTHTQHRPPGDRVYLMDQRPLPFKKIILVCTNSREADERVCCAGGDSIALHAELKDWVARNGIKRHVRICKSGCMDRCEEGPNALVMPDNLWISGLDRTALETLKAQLAEEFAVREPKTGGEGA